MLITRKSPFTGKVVTKDLPVTQKQIDSWQGGVLLQNAFPQLDANAREFIKTGITAEEWDEFLGGAEEIEQ